MYLAYRGYPGDPGTLNTFLIKVEGFGAGCEINPSASDALGFCNYKGKDLPDYKAACDLIDQSYGLIAKVDGYKKFILLTGCSGDEGYYVRDPTGSRNSYRHSEVNTIFMYN